MAFTYTPFSYGDFSFGDYSDSDETKSWKKQLNNVLKNQPGEYTSQYGSTIDNLLNKITNREAFSYDFNADPIYQQYKDQYTKLGNEAAMNGAAAASALTSGYGNSYAATAATQANQQYLTQLNNVIPELYQAALDKYDTETENLYNQLSAYGDQEDRLYNRYRDDVSDWQNNRDYYSDQYNNSKNFDWSQYTSNRDFAYGKYSDDRNLAYDQYTNDRNLDYQIYQDSISKTSGGSSGGSGGSGGGDDNYSDYSNENAADTKTYKGYRSYLGTISGKDQASVNDLRAKYIGQRLKSGNISAAQAAELCDTFNIDPSDYSDYFNF